MHTSISGGLPESLRRARELGATAMQMFSHNPRGWAMRALSDAEAGEFRRLKRELGIRPVVIHASYLVNLTSAEGEIREKSIRMLKEELARGDAIGADYVVLHAGYQIGREEGGARPVLIKAIKTALAGRRGDTGLLIENTAGVSVGEVARIAKEAGTAGICLDTCHAWAAGYDVGAPEGLALLKKEIGAAWDLKRVRVIHLNDSRGTIGSGWDRHDHIGKGKIGLEGMREFLAFKPFSDVPLILETPKDNPGDDRRNLETVRKLLAGTR